jgi:hypothetical protein
VAPFPRGDTLRPNPQRALGAPDLSQGLPGPWCRWSPAASAEGARRYRRYAVGQRRRLSCPTRRSSSATRWRSVAFSAWRRAIVAAVSRARVCRQRAIRHFGEQTCCGRRPVRGRPQTAHRRAVCGVRTSPTVRAGAGTGDGVAPGRRRARRGVHGPQARPTGPTRCASASAWRPEETMPAHAVMYRLPIGSVADRLRMMPHSAVVCNDERCIWRAFRSRVPMA